MRIRGEGKKKDGTYSACIITIPSSTAKIAGWAPGDDLWGEVAIASCIATSPDGIEKPGPAHPEFKGALKRCAIKACRVESYQGEECPACGQAHISSKEGRK